MRIQQAGRRGFLLLGLTETEDEIASLSSDESKNSTHSLALVFATRYTLPRITLHDSIKESGGEVERDVSHRQDLAIFDRSTPTYNDSTTAWRGS